MTSNLKPNEISYIIEAQIRNISVQEAVKQNLPLTILFKEKTIQNSPPNPYIENSLTLFPNKIPKFIK